MAGRHDVPVRGTRPWARIQHAVDGLLQAIASVPGVGPVEVNVVWDPPWEPSRMSDEARVVLNMW